MDKRDSFSKPVEKTDIDESNMQEVQVPAPCKDANVKGMLDTSVDSGIHADVTKAEEGADKESLTSAADDNLNTNTEETVGMTIVKEAAVKENAENCIPSKDITDNYDKPEVKNRNEFVCVSENCITEKNIVRRSLEDNVKIHDESNVNQSEEVNEISESVDKEFDKVKPKKSVETSKEMDVVEKNNIFAESEQLLVDSSSNMMEYRTAEKGNAVDGSSDSSPDSSDSEDETANHGVKVAHDTEAQLNKIISHERDASPEREKRVKLNRHGFEDIRTKGELLPEDLPPLEELTITVDESVVMVEVGNIKSIVGILVVIQSNENVPPLDDETILFVKGHKVLGQVFEVFGPVKTPWYSVRFNEVSNIEAKGLKVGMPVFCAPREDSFTKFVFVDSLKTVKGSDASWEDNNEPPEKHLDYSDDESERRAKAKRRNKKFGDNEADNGEDGDSAMHKKNPRQRNRNRPNRDDQTGTGQEQQSQQPKRGWNPFKDNQNTHGNSGPPRYGGRHQANENFNHPNRQRWPAGQNNFNRPQSRFGGPPNFQNRPRMGQNQGQPQYSGRNMKHQNSWRPSVNTNFQNDMQISGISQMNSPSNRTFNMQVPPQPMNTPGFVQNQGQNCPQTLMNVDFSQPPPQFQTGNHMRPPNQPAGVNPWMGSQVVMTQQNAPFIATKIPNLNNQSFPQGNQSISHQQMNFGNQIHNQGQPANSGAFFQSNQSHFTQTGTNPVQSSIGNVPNLSMNSTQNTFNQPLPNNFQSNQSMFQTNSFGGQSKLSDSNEPVKGSLNISNFTPSTSNSFQLGGMNPMSCNNQSSNLQKPELSNFQLPNIPGQGYLNNVQNGEKTNLTHNQNLINNQQQGISQGNIQSTTLNNQFVSQQGYCYQSNFVGQHQPAGQGGFNTSTSVQYTNQCNLQLPNGGNIRFNHTGENAQQNVITDQRFIQNNS